MHNCPDRGIQFQENEKGGCCRTMKRSVRRNLRQAGTAASAVLFTVFLIYTGLAGDGIDWKYHIQERIFDQAQQMYLPVLSWVNRTPEKGIGEWIREKALAWIPLVSYAEDHAAYDSSLEDEETLARILEAQANDENVVDENGNLIGEPDESETDAAAVTPAVDTSIEKLRDFEYLLGNFYTVDSSTMIDSDQLNADDLLGRSMKIDTGTDGPKVLIYHTHSQEEFADSTPGDTSTSIVGVGEYLTQLLNEKGIEAIHDTGVYDIIDGKLDRSNAYEYAGEAVEKILAENPTVEVLIDLHRDGVAEGTHLVTEINGKPTAKIMFFNGLSRSRTNGNIDYLPNPYIQDNLAFSLQMQIDAENKYPGFVRHIYLRAYRYNLHLMPKSLLVEAGAQTNTVEEMMNAMEVLSEMLEDVLVGE